MLNTIGEKETGNHLIKSTSLEKNSEPCRWLLLRSKSRMLNTIGEKETGNHLIKSTSLEKRLRALSLVSATLVEYATQFFFMKNID